MAGQTNHPQSAAIVAAKAAAIDRCRKKYGDVVDTIVTTTATLEQVVASAEAQVTSKQGESDSKRQKISRAYVIFAKKVDVFASIIDIYIKQAPEVASVVWGVCRILIQTGVVYIEFSEKLAENMSMIASQIGILERTRTLFHASDEMQSALGMAYGDILEFTIRVGVFMKKAGIVKYLSTLVKDWKIRFGDVLDSFTKHMKMVHDQGYITLLERVLLNCPDRNTIQDRLRRLRSWLLPPGKEYGYLKSDIETLSSARHVDTCSWFAPELEQFLQTKDSNLLLLSGDPGFGKTHLSAWIMEQAQASVGPQGITVLSFFIHENSSTSQSAFDVARGLLLQLLALGTDATLFDRLFQLYQTSDLKYITDIFQKEIWLILRDALTSDQKALIVVDGLDELSACKSQAVFFLQWLQDARADFANEDQFLKCIITSRTPNYAVPSAWELRPLTKSDNSKDVESFITHTLSKSQTFTSLESAKQNRIRDLAISKAEGMFLWAQFTLDSLATAAAYETMSGMLEATPQGLDAIYKSILTKLDLSDQDVTRILQFLLACGKPPSVIELSTYLSIELSEPQLIPRIRSVEDDITAKCSPLVRIDNGYICFAHLSVKQYITDHFQESIVRLDQKEAHFQMALRTLQYLNLPIEDLPYSMPLCVDIDTQSRELFQATASKYPLLSYSTSSWVRHLQQSGKVDPAQGGTASFSNIELAIPSYQPVAWMEHAALREEYQLLDLCTATRLAFELRLAVLGKDHSETVQTMLNLAMLEFELSRYTKAVNMYRQAWRFCKDNLDEHSDAAFSCAAKLIKALEAAHMDEDVIEVSLWVWRTYKDMLSPGHEKSLAAGSHISWLFLRQGRTDESIKVDQELWTVCKEKFGEADPKTARIADTLAKAFAVCAEKSWGKQTWLAKSRDVYQAVWHAVKNHKAAIVDDLYITAICNYVHALETCHEEDAAEAELRSATQNIPDYSGNKLKQYLQLHLELSKFLSRRQSTADAREVLVKAWAELKHRLVDSDPSVESTIPAFRAMALTLRNQGRYEEAAEMYGKILSVQRSLLGITDASVVGASSHLATVFRHAKDEAAEENILRSTFNDARMLDASTQGTLQSAINLTAYLQRKGSWRDASLVWNELVQKLWPTLATGSTALGDANESEFTIPVAHRWAIALSRCDDLEAARMAYQNTFQLCMARCLGQQECLNLLRDYSKFLVSINQRAAAMEIHETYYTELNRLRGELSRDTVDALHELATAYANIGKDLVKAEAQYALLLKLTRRLGGKLSEASLEIFFSLAKIRKSQGRQKQADLELLALWDDIWKQSFQLEAGSPSFTLNRDTVKQVYVAATKIAQKIPGVSKKVDGQFKVIILKHFENDQPEAMARLAMTVDRLGQTRDAMALYENVLQRDGESTGKISHQTIVSIATRLADIYLEIGNVEVAAQTVTPFVGKGMDSGETLAEAVVNIAAAYMARPSPENSLKTFDLLFNTLDDIDKGGAHITKVVTLIASSAVDSGQVCKLRDKFMTLVEKCSRYVQPPLLRHLAESLGCIYIDGTDTIEFRSFWEALLPYSSTEPVLLRLAVPLGRAYMKSGQTDEIRSLGRAVQSIRPCGRDQVGIEKCLQELCQLAALNMETEKVAYESLRILKHYTDGSFGILHYFSTAWSNTAALQPMLEVVSKETEAWILEHCGSLRESSLWSVIQHHLLVQLLNAIQTNSKFGPEHVCTAIVRNKIANCHMRLKEFAEAMSHFNWLRGMLVTEKLGTDALWTLGPEVLSNLKYDGQFRVSESKNFSEIALGLAKFIYDRALKHFPLNDDGLYKHVEAYKRVLCDRRDYTAVRDMYESLWQDRPHAWESKCLSRIGLVLAEDCFVRGLMMEAIQRASEVLSRNTTFFGSTDRETIAASNLISEFYTGRGQYEKSLQIHTRMVQLLEENGASGQKYTEQVNLKGRALQRLGQWKDAERVYNRLWNHLAKDIPIAYFARKSENLRVWEERARETKAPPPKSWHHEKHWEKSLGSM